MHGQIIKSIIHWNLCKKYHIPASEKWWENNVKKVQQNEEVKILLDFKIQTDKLLTHNIPDIKVIETKQVWLIDVAISGGSRIDQKEMEKITKYQDLKIEVERLWGKEGNSSASGDRSPGSNTQRSRQAYENFRAGQDLTKSTQKSSTTENSSLPAKNL